jgi:hypothetical protein
MGEQEHGLVEVIEDHCEVKLACRCDRDMQVWDGTAPMARVFEDVRHTWN